MVKFKNLWSNPWIKSISMILGIFLTVLGIIKYISGSQEKQQINSIQISNATLSNSPVLQNSPSTSITYLTDPTEKVYSEQDVIKLLNSVNPKILSQYKQGWNKLCVMISSYNLNQLMSMRGWLGEKNILTFQSNGSVSFGSNNTTGNCINDLEDGNLNGYIFEFLPKANILLTQTNK